MIHTANPTYESFRIKMFRSLLPKQNHPAAKFQHTQKRTIVDPGVIRTTSTHWPILPVSTRFSRSPEHSAFIKVSHRNEFIACWLCATARDCIRVLCITFVRIMRHALLCSSFIRSFGTIAKRGNIVTLFVRHSFALMHRYYTHMYDVGLL